MASSKPTVTYFNGKGRAEFARVILSEAGVEFTDNRLDDISGIKDKLAFGQVPLLEIDGLKLVQSITIARYLARKYNLYGKTLEEGALADMIVDGVVDFNSARSAAKTDEQKEVLAKETIPKWLGYFEKLLTSNNGGKGWFVGEQFTYADIGVYLVISFLQNNFAGAVDNFPHLKDHVARVAARPNIAKWLEVRPKTQW